MKDDKPPVPGSSAPTWNQDVDPSATMDLPPGADVPPPPDAGGDGQTPPLASEQPGRYADPRGRRTLLGRGGMGDVHLVVDQHLGRQVARKEIRAGAAGSQGSRAVRRFLHEARLTARLEHPAIVSVYDLGVNDEGLPYYTMRRVDGQTLSELLQAAGSVEERLRLVEAVREACNALAYAHAHGVVHRDLKPDNIMIGSFGDTVVLDWGIARASSAPGEAEPTTLDLSDLGDGRTLDGAVVGTPQYMSPEQTAGELSRLGPPSDVWSLGAILFEVLAGRKLIDTRSPQVALQRVLTLRADDLPWPDDRGIPRELKAIVRRALQAEPEDRYPDAAAMAEDLQAWWDGALVSAVDYHFRDHLLRFARRTLPILVTVAASLLIIVVLLVVGGLRLEQERDRAIAAHDQAKVLLLEARAREAEARDAPDLAIAYTQAARALQDSPARQARLNRLAASAPARSGFQTHGGVFSKLARLQTDNRSLLLVTHGRQLATYDADTGQELASYTLSPEDGPGRTVLEVAGAGDAWFVLLGEESSGARNPGRLCVLDASLASRDCMSVPAARSFQLRVDRDGRTVLVSENKGPPRGAVFQRVDGVWQQHKVRRAVALADDGGLWIVDQGQPRTLSARELSTLPVDVEVAMVTAGADGGTLAWRNRAGPLLVRHRGQDAPVSTPAPPYNLLELVVLSSSDIVVGHAWPRSSWLAQQDGGPYTMDLEGGVVCSADGRPTADGQPDPARPTTLVLTPGRRSPHATIVRKGDRRVPEQSQRALEQPLEACVIDQDRGRIALLTADGWLEWIAPVVVAAHTRDVDRNPAPTTSYARLSPDRQRLAVGGRGLEGRGVLERLDAATLGPLSRRQGEGIPVAASPDDGWIAWEDGRSDYLDPRRHGGTPRLLSSSLRVQAADGPRVQPLDADQIPTDHGRLSCQAAAETGCCTLHPYIGQQDRSVCAEPLRSWMVEEAHVIGATPGASFVLLLRPPPPAAAADGRRLLVIDRDGATLRSDLALEGAAAIGRSLDERFLGIVDHAAAQVIDLPTGAVAWRRPLQDIRPSQAQPPAVSDDGRALVVLDLTSAVCYADADRDWCAIPPQPAESIALSADGGMVAIVRNDGLTVHQAEDAAVLQELPAEATIPNSTWAWFLDDDALLTVSKKGPYVRRIPLQTGLWQDTPTVLARTGWRICEDSYDAVRPDRPDADSVWAAAEGCEDPSAAP